MRFAALSGSLDVITATTPATKNKVGLAVGTNGPEDIADFECAGVPVSLRGSFIIEVKVNSMTNVPTWKITEARGAMKPAAFADGIKAEAEAKVGVNNWESVGFAMTLKVASQEKLEINSSI